jgi:hypothetical protein
MRARSDPGQCGDDVMSAELGDLSLGADQPATGRMLIRQRRCVAICLLAIDAETGSCGCQLCHGKLHGALSHLLDALVDGAPRRVGGRLPGEPDEPALFDVALPEPAGATR